MECHCLSQIQGVNYNLMKNKQKLKVNHLSVVSPIMQWEFLLMRGGKVWEKINFYLKNGKTTLFETPLRRRALRNKNLVVPGQLIGHEHWISAYLQSYIFRVNGKIF